jgi:hypothetical protein
MTGERPVIGQSRPVVNYLVVNSLVKVVDQTTPLFGYLSLMSAQGGA